MTNKNGHGGARPGAGRPRSLDSTRSVRADQVVARKMKGLAEQGLEVLADNYPDLMRKAVDLALGHDDKMPNVTILKSLLELMVRVVGADTEPEDARYQKIVEGFLARVQETRATDGRPMDVGSGGTVLRTDSGHLVRAAADPTLPGMGVRISLEQSE